RGGAGRQDARAAGRRYLYGQERRGALGRHDREVMLGTSLSASLSAFSILIGVVGALTTQAQGRVKDALRTATHARSWWRLPLDGAIAILLLCLVGFIALFTYPLLRESIASFDLWSLRGTLERLFVLIWFVLPLLAAWQITLVVRVIAKKPYPA